MAVGTETMSLAMAVVVVVVVEVTVGLAIVLALVYWKSMVLVSATGVLGFRPRFLLFSPIFYFLGIKKTKWNWNPYILVARSNGLSLRHVQSLLFGVEDSGIHHTFIMAPE